MRLRPFQAAIKTGIYNEWDNGAVNVLATAPTGSGKTVLFSNILSEHDGGSCAIAHRQELVSQISIALNRNEVYHKIIAPEKVVRTIVGFHMQDMKHSFYRSSARCAVAGVDTLVRRGDDLSNWLNSVTLWVQDEGHHVLKSNKWGTAAGMFPNARGLGVTATPGRADRKGLGRHADGLFDVMVEGPQMRELINMGYLTDYRIFAPPSDIDLSNVPITASGDYSPQKLTTAVRRSHVIGDVVTHYLRIARGKLGITFATDVQTATDIAAQFNAAGVPAAVVSAKTPDAERVAILHKFKNRQLLQLVNVDLFGEGFDLPAIEVVSMARPTESLGLFYQQFGRGLRLMISPILSGAWDTYTDKQRRDFIAASDKPVAIIIDHVGNIMRHGLPDRPRSWSLDRGDKRGKSEKDNGIPLRACPECTAAYERIYKACPFCGFIPVPTIRSGPEFVDGDLKELDADTLAKLRGEIAYVDMDPADARQVMASKYMPEIGIRAGVKRHVERQAMQEGLRASMAWWAGIQRYLGRDDSESDRRFYHTFGVDKLTAQALNTRDALDLANRINLYLGQLNYD